MAEPVLVRLARLPAALPAALGTPELTERLRHLARAETAYRACAHAVAEQIGEELVTALPPRLRGRALDVRRSLLRGDFVEVDELGFRPLGRIAEWAAALSVETGALRAAVAGTEAMRHGLAWELAERELGDVAPVLVDDVRGRLAAGEPWTSRALRERGDQVSRLLFRSALSVAPRAKGATGVVALPPRLPELITHLGRLTAVLGGLPAHPALDLVGPEARPVTEIVARAMAAGGPHRAALPSPRWPEPRPRTVYQRLCEWMARHADEPEIDLGPATLDYLGVPPARPSPWPVDCVLRPLPGRRAVVEAVVPAGTASGGFAAAAHRAFLVEAAARCGAEPVEVLVPGQAGERRPRYTRTWTGDPDAESHVDEPDGLREHLPLSGITLRRDARGVIAEDRGGRVLWPVHHTTRRPSAPWDLVVALLTAACPAHRLAATRVFGDPRPAFPGLVRTPRLVLDGDLVIAPATVFAGREVLPEPGGGMFERARALANLRLVTGAPRWVVARQGRRACPVDLDNLATATVLDRLSADPAVPGVVLEELLPAPGDLPVSDADGQAHAARVLARLPFAAPSQAADEVTRAWRQVTERRPQRAAEASA